MQTSTQTQANQAQLGALESGCGLVRWEDSSIIRHSGPDALDLLNRLTTNELLSITEGRARRTVLASDKGRVVDVFLVAHVAENDLLLISDTDKSGNTVSEIDRYTIIDDAELNDLTATHARISLIGPQAAATAESVTGTAVSDDTSVMTDIRGAQISVSSDTSRGIEWLDIICLNETADELAVKLEHAGAVAINAATFDLFRISHKIPGPGREYGDHSNPLESDLLSLIAFDKGCYIGQEVIARLDSYDKVQRNLKVLESETPLEAGTKLVSDSTPAGIVTSASPIKTADGVYVALGLVRVAYLEPGTQLEAAGITAKVR